jgi:radical SAM protein with 4Fe4S-binding SPASM domain
MARWKPTTCCAARGVSAARSRPCGTSPTRGCRSRWRGGFAGNLERFDELEAILRELPLKGWSIDVPCPAGALLDHPDLLPDPARAAALMARSFGGGFYGSSGDWACGAHLAAVMADGTVDKCGYFTGLRSGHLREGLAAAWSRIPRWRLGELSCRCPHLAECRGGCRFRARAHGDLLGPDPALCPQGV